tara:strand:+ start:75823 stop:76629 length:807 start_codon:yes stop_codon:yes gene_type:complete
MAFKKLKYWFDTELAELLAQKISVHNPDFNSIAFVNAIDKGVVNLELKDRIALFADELHYAIKSDYQDTVALFLKILGPENEEETGMFTNYYWIMPIAKYVEKYGLENFDCSMEAIQEITKRNTGEYTIRPFIEKYQSRTLPVLLEWSKHQNNHVRRLSSEGVRPRLPWATKLQQFIDDPKPIVPILENLKDDTSKYVQKSVANCINDILKDNFQIGKALLDRWSKKPSKERKWIIKHALRNFVKQQNEWAMTLITTMNETTLPKHKK